MKNVKSVTIGHRSLSGQKSFKLFAVSIISVFAMLALSLSSYADINDPYDMSVVSKIKLIPNGFFFDDIRDPNIYSGDYTLESAPYAITGKDKLSLADDHSRWYVSFEKFEYAFVEEHESFSFDGRFIWGRDYDKAIFSSEGKIDDNSFNNASSELLWSHAVSAFWDRQIGARYNFGDEKDQVWITAGFQGLAPYWFEVDIKSSVSMDGQIALDVETEYDLLLTQQLILQPRLEMSIYGKDDKEREIASGFSSVATGLRLRYELSRQFAPYVGVEWEVKLGDTRDILKQENGVTQETFGVAGVRFWF
ncbi:copper resistance protein B [Vibrio sp. F74]|uniref:copper resistance protein B n=1 Tax=Vibrio sp. F74 TaxID=700020 RepID=UPI0035F5D3D0